MNKVCIGCTKTFVIDLSVAKIKSDPRRANKKYCSISCYRKVVKGKIHEVHYDKGNIDIAEVDDRGSGDF